MLLLRAPSNYASVTMNDMIRKVRDDTDARCWSNNMPRPDPKLSDQTHRDAFPLPRTSCRKLRADEDILAKIYNSRDLLIQ